MHFESWLYEKSDRSSHSPPTTWDYPQKPVQKAPAWPQKMLSRLQRWLLTIIFEKRTTLHLADTFSRDELPPQWMSRVTGFKVFRTKLTGESADTHNPRFTETTKSCQCDGTKKDEHLSKLLTTIFQGWPAHRTRYHNHCGCNGPTRISQQLLKIAVCTKVQAEMLL